jgi:hypothetical protein
VCFGSSFEVRNQNLILCYKYMLKTWIPVATHGYCASTSTLYTRVYFHNSTPNQMVVLTSNHILLSQLYSFVPTHLSQIYLNTHVSSTKHYELTSSRGPPKNVLVCPVWGMGWMPVRVDAACTQHRPPKHIPEQNLPIFRILQLISPKNAHKQIT